MKLDLETLKQVKFLFQIHSDHSTNCNGYRGLLDLIKKAEAEQLILSGVVSTSKCEHEPRYYDTKYTSCKKCNKVLQMKP